VRLAYVQHPFPAQGRTTDTAHLIVAEHATEEGSYVAITRARQQAHVYASRELLEIDQSEPYIEPLAEHVARAEPEIPSIRYPLAHEAHIAREHAREHDRKGEEHERAERQVQSERDARESRQEQPGPRPLAALGSHRLGALRPPPTDPERLAVWRQAADLVKSYRARHGLDTAQPGLPGSAPPAGSFSERYERAQLEQRVLEALAKVDPELEGNRLLQEQALERLGLPRAHSELERDRSPGFEP
jgi:hypothetical protein